MATGIDHTLTKQQQEIVDYKGNEILVRGYAGSGKTLVMLRKAKLTAEKYPDQSIAVFTYGRTLTNASNLLMKKYNLDNLKILTFHSWAMSTNWKIFRKKCYMIDKCPKDFLSIAIEALNEKENHRFLKDNKYKEFLKDEISWIKGKGITTLDDYLKVSRRGRGSEVRVTEKDRHVIYKIYKQYDKEKDYWLDYDDLGLILSQHMDKLPEESKFDHIFIDEGQDLQQVQLMLLRAIARKSFFIAADKGQKIYKTSFAWKDIGLNIKGGRTKVLRESFRSTKEIIQLASSLQQNDAIMNDEEYIPAEIPNRSGPKPTLFHCASEKVQDEEVVKAVKMLKEEAPEATVAILARGRESLNRINKVLKANRVYPEWVNRKQGNPFEPGVKLCTIHSSKGLEFDFVIIIDLVEPNADKDMEMDDEYWEYERRLLYVGMTRASSYLQLFCYDKASRLLKELDTSLYEKVKVGY